VHKGQKAGTSHQKGHWGKRGHNHDPRPQKKAKMTGFSRQDTSGSETHIRHGRKVAHKNTNQGKGRGNESAFDEFAMGKN